MNISGTNPLGLVHPIKQHRAEAGDRKGFRDALASKTVLRKAASIDAFIVTKTVVASTPETAKIVSVQPMEEIKKIEYNWPPTFSKDPATLAQLADLRKAAENSNYAGMTLAQVYKEIFDRYNNAFNGNIHAIACFVETCLEWGDINNQFVTELDSTFKSFFRENPSVTQRGAYNEMMGYAGMAFSEIEAAITEKYGGDGSVAGFMNMIGEMMRSGTLDNKMGYIDGSSLAHSFVKNLTRSMSCSYDANYPANLTMSKENLRAMLGSSANWRSLVSGSRLGRQFLDAFLWDSTEYKEDLVDRLLDQLFKSHGSR
ncbi:MAG: hypothetical protein FWG42_08350 [Clostridiales bacterium]|nr:hypothetical protein [Clostridiales bacterium]